MQRVQTHPAFLGKTWVFCPKRPVVSTNGNPGGTGTFGHRNIFLPYYDDGSNHQIRQDNSLKAYFYIITFEH